MSEYAPSTGNVRVAYVTGAVKHLGIDRDEASAEFDRWLAAHDAQVRADERELVARAIEERDFPGPEGTEHEEWSKGVRGGLTLAAIIARDHGGDDHA